MPTLSHISRFACAASLFCTVAAIAAQDQSAPPPSTLMVDMLVEGGGVAPAPAIVVGKGAFALARHVVDGSDRFMLNEGTKGYTPLTRVILDDPANDVIILGTEGCGPIQQPVAGIATPKIGQAIEMWTIRKDCWVVVRGRVVENILPYDSELFDTDIPTVHGDSGAPVYESESGRLIGSVVQSRRQGDQQLAAFTPARTSWTLAECGKSERVEDWLARRGKSEVQVARLWSVSIDQLRQGDVADAKAGFLKALAIEGTNRDVILGVLGCLSLENPPGARKEFLESLLAKNPQNAVAWVELGHDHLRAKEDAAAEKAYRNALEIKDSAVVRYWLATAVFRQSGASAAASCLHSASDAFPKCIPIQRRLLQFARDANDPVLSLLALRRIHEGMPESGEAAWDYGVSLLFSGQKKDAQIVLDKLRQVDPIWANRLQYSIENAGKVNE